MPLRSVLVMIGLLAACSPRPDGGGALPPATDAAAADNRYTALERVDDAAVVQLYADGFEALPLREKTVIWHLSQAALAGRDIYLDQRHRHSLEMRGVIEAILTYPQGIDPRTLTAVQQYAKRFWIHSGPYHATTSRKFVLDSTPEALLAAARTAAAAGAVFPSRVGEPLEALLERLEPMFFDASVEPLATNKAPGDGVDPIASSANNLYADVTAAEVAGFTERYALNSRLVKRNGRLAEEVYRIDGKYGPQIAGIIRHLEAAVPLSSETTAAALRALIQWYRTGEDASRRRFDIAWVQDREPVVDTINGFIETYMDPRGVKGSWEAVVFHVNEARTGRMRTFAQNAQWFEDNMPFDARFRKPTVQGIVAHAVDVVLATGEAGPLPPAGINLPNDQAIREQNGSKSITLANVTEAADAALPDTLRREFSWSPEEAARADAWSTLSATLITEMHEVIGHASGQQAPGRATALIGPHFAALEEARADLVGLYFLADPKLVELGIVRAADQESLVRAAYEGYARGALTQLRMVRNGTVIAGDHMRAVQLVVRWLMANTKAIEERSRDGKRFLVVVDPVAFRDGAGRLLAEVQQVKSLADAAAAARLLETYGITIDPQLRDEVVARVDALDPPALVAFVMPKLTAVTGANGQITDVRISYPRDLAAQMLEYSGATQRAAPRSQLRPPS